MDIIKCALQHFVGDFARRLIEAQIAARSSQFYVKVQYDTQVPQISHHTYQSAAYLAKFGTQGRVRHTWQNAAHLEK